MKELKKETVFMHGVILLLILVNPIITYFVVDYKIDNLGNDVIKKYLAIEYDKVGGMDNYVKITNATRDQAKAWAEQYDAQGDGGANVESNDSTDTQESYNAKSMSPEQASQLTGDSLHVLGNKDAEITVIEYSDLECPFCKKLHESGVIETTQLNYGDNVNVVFKQFPLTMHPGAQMQAEATLCVGDLAGTDKYYEFITSIFKNSKQNGNSFTANSISDLGSEIGVDKTELLTCISSGKFKDEVKKQMEEGLNVFGVKSTPSSVIINNKTGEWEILPGAYPYDSFKEIIDYLVSK